MILRRLADALRRQDWGTVLVEFLVVVLGIFVGLQVTNWNEQRLFDNQERLYLQQLRDEIEDNQRALRAQVEFTEAVVAGGRRALGLFERGEPCQPQCAERLVDLFHASQVWGTPLTTSSYEELKRLGLPSDVGLRDRIQPYYRYLAGWDTVNQTPPAFREQVRGFIQPEAFEILWHGCYAVTDGEVEVLSTDCVETLREAVDTSIAFDRAAADSSLADQLRFWIGQNVYATTYYPQVSMHADEAIAAIEAALDGESWAAER